MLANKFKLVFIKKSAKLSKEALQLFVLEIIRAFGGLSLLSNLKISCYEDSTLSIEALSKESMAEANVALILCGGYKEIECCFTQE